MITLRPQRPHKPAATKPAHKRPAPRAGTVGAWPAGTNGYTAVVFVSSSDRATALAFAHRVARLGYPAGVLRSSDYSSLQPGSFVAFAGVYKSPAKADDAVAKIRASGIAGAPYVRFIGGHR